MNICRWLENPTLSFTSLLESRGIGADVWEDETEDDVWYLFESTYLSL